MEYIPKIALDGAMSYPEYRQLVTGLWKEGKTTGEKQSPELLEYAGLNEQRMNRIEKTFRLDAEVEKWLKAIDQPVIWLTLTEGWCGDASQILPVIHGLALQNQHITLKFLLRDEHLDIMDAFLTNGARSIPITIFVSPEDGRVLGSWGSRPAAAQALMLEFKKRMLDAPDAATKAALYDEAKTAVHAWYAHDRTVSIQQELLKKYLTASGHELLS
jgi:hypothetical protein